MDTYLSYISFYAVSISSTIALHLVVRDQENIGTQFGTRLQDWPRVMIADHFPLPFFSTTTQSTAEEMNWIKKIDSFNFDLTN